ncbi:hypothetical protein OG2516_15994 [Oceanicola granulosus HTCC2516]|uniref:Uncharacterized protein n=1 Tax=Oceanicola granulosus (strain ATCC BAA-861 / DSM 15982 / KCTC 12143 / HTCC2516) TaxID=314256 RepID=Q2CGW7_OCEGH|nr:hypothetical protein [Oceanicola granulosus]EAR51818.1 hypothetical protein OG2516_15994 [Oceanicola granulosus HTCC2516]
MLAQPFAAGPGQLAAAVEQALDQARAIRAMLYDTVIPHLPPLRRGAAEHIIRCIDRGSIFLEKMLHDLDALIALVEREAEAGTRHGWQADDNHVRGGWPTLHRDERASALSWSASELSRFHGAIAAVLDAAKAERATTRLLED